MANEVTATCTLAYEDSELADISLAVLEKHATVATKKFIHMKQAIGFAAEEALDMGELSAPFGWAMFVNRDTTNYVEIRSGSGASNDIIKLLAGEFACFRFGSDITAPYAIANTAAVQLEYIIIST